MTDWTKIVSGEELESAAKERTKKFITKQVSVEELDLPENADWKEIKRNKSGKTVTLKKDKRLSDVFENQVWMIFYKMGFTHMNLDNSFVLDLHGNSKQIDILAMDDETCLFVECKSTAKLDKSPAFKQELESIHGYYPDACKAIEEHYGIKKFKFIFATENYLIADDSNDKKRMDSFGFYYINDDAVSYYTQLAEHLGRAARFQLLGNLFANEEISGIDNSVTAVKGTMGGLSYYTFLIEPGKLLKMAYVLHRNEANHLLMPTYQRLIKKERLAAIRQFVNAGGFFPNSLIVSIDCKEDENLFSEFSGQDAQSTKAGILHLPKKYRSIYVIDGQHRLYGYSEANDIAFSNVIPVVAFLNLPPDKQVAMFMEINENQKKVSKSLRNTLNIDLLWNSNNPNERKHALMLKIAEELGDYKHSPLYGRIITGENASSNLRCITTEYVKDAIKESRFLNQYAKNGAKTYRGTIDKDNNDQTAKSLLKFLCKCFGFIANILEDEWSKGSEGYLATNNVVYALIRMFDDISWIALQKQGKTFINDVDEICAVVEPMLEDLCLAIDSLDQQSRIKLKEKGGAAKKTAWRTLQVALNSKNPEFTNEDIQEYIADYCTDNNPDAENYLNELEDFFKNMFRAAIGSDTDWLVKYAPLALASRIAQTKADTNIRRKSQNLPEYDTWHFISFNEMCDIGMNGNNWTAFAQNIFARPNVKNTKMFVATWLRDLARYKDKVRRKEHIIRMEFAQIESIHHDFIIN